MAVCIKDQIQNMNLVIGCTIGCSYCYARNNVRRFHMTEDFSRPEYFPGKLKLMDRKRPRNLLLTGMSDFSDWDPEWREEVFARIGQNPQHQYIFLTKRPEKVRFSTELDNVWFGVTVTSEKEKGRIKAMREHIRAKHYQVSFEPMFDNIGEVDFTGVEWIVVGTETGRRKGKSESKQEWVWNLTNQAHSRGIPVFMKEDLLSVMGEAQMIQELPQVFYDVLEEQKAWKSR
ncbi:MAG TPA: radical SAM mobile pair protein A [Candidatus Mediterraneibacter gallistercoris]|uniref:Radical SAM mobile pair protein A n=1 Tax=Candidatus Mediterraneibacter gallistercoris TaxID=2838671 RepID=A0A9D2P893_9FIRM|nr:radical SAM mobile pair protein A [Candidatus Mediterraneibacter gallistercoris]